MEKVKGTKPHHSFLESNPLKKAFAEVGENLKAFLKEENLDGSLRELSDQILRTNPTMLDRFKLSSAVVYMLQTPGHLNSSSQKITAVSLLVGAYSNSHWSRNPFATIIYKLVKDQNEVGRGTEKMYLNQVEKLIVSKLISANDEAWAQNLDTLIESCENELKETKHPILFVSNEELKIAVEQHAKLLDKALFENSKNEDSDLSIKSKVMQHHELENDELMIPPIYSTNDELAWMNPTEIPSAHKPELHRNFPIEELTEIDSEIKELMQQAFKEALSLSQRQKVLDQLRKGPQIVTHLLGVIPEVMAELVENNPLIAIEVLLKLLDSEEDMTDYLTGLIQMDMSVHSMEVVNRLTTSVKLPDQFLYQYISNCIKTCEGMQDKFVQSRLVRLLCVFLQSLIRNQTIDFQVLYIEILTFCVEFSRIREAAALYRLMKQFESEDPDLREVLTKKLEMHQHLSEAAKSFTSKDKDPK